MKIPITVGVTGHRDIRQEYLPQVRRLVCRELKKLQNNYPDSEFVMLNSLASGADSLCAEEALKLGYRLVCPLPMDLEDYKKDFMPGDLKIFEKLLESADHVFVAPHKEPEPAVDTAPKTRLSDDTINLSKKTSIKLESMYAEYKIDRNFLYRQAGIYVASHCHVLLALWDGLEGKPGGCGTAEAVDFMLRKNYEGENYFNPANDGAVIHIYTPRKSTLCEQEERIYVTLLENEKGCLSSILQRTNEFNRDYDILSGKNPKVSSKNNVSHKTDKKNSRKSNDSVFPIEIKEGDSVSSGYIHLDGQEDKIPGKKNHDEEVLRQFFPHKRIIPEPMRQLVETYDAADRLSMKSQKFYLLMLGLMSFFCVLLVLCFLLYDELELKTMLLCFGGVIIIYALSFHFLGQGRHHEKYLNYRLMAESLRIEIYLRSAGITDNICSDFTWTQKHDSAWVKEAMEAIIASSVDGMLPEPRRKGGALISPDEICDAWMLGQSNYHIKAHQKAEKKNRIAGHITRWVLVLSILLFIFILLAEFCFPMFMDKLFWGASVCAWCKVLWGCFSAITLFISGYFGNLSYERKAKDHLKMALLFDSAYARYEHDPGNYRSIFRELAREEIIENGNWMSYCSENRPTFTL